MEKVKVNKILFDFLEYYDWKEKKSRNVEKILKDVLNGKKYDDERSEILNNIEPIVLLDCLYYGYELEETKEDILLNEFNENKIFEDGTYKNGIYNGILITLKILDIKIKGINI